ncbi:cation:dicarboxylate symporter family transporter [Desulfolutivibrio sulfoxidireducens]|uniref:cation:dicarboxylate symporter family transporter n=1 Tax=Desulfolutivibrio sulfoxidireducens TaxID=2773299 RepID=UPI00159D340F|nr:cation:dicarboxylase symporter family transporter [Desulfolutivibrio sulfoxidireducens]QLA20345.1 cation:dicarboxylase symporter family transporter [Desulfolutivibrio sulfoxidireducens]
MRHVVRIVSLAFVMFLVALPCLGAGPHASAMPDDIRDIQQSGVLRIGVIEAQAPPFIFEQDGRLTGFDVDLARQLAVALGVRPEFVRIPGGWDGLVDAVAAMTVDIGLSELTKNMARTQRAYFSRPYFLSHAVFIANRLAMAQNRIDAADLDSVQAVARHFDAPGLRIATMARSALEPLVRELFPRAEIVPAPSSQAAIAMVYEGQADLVMVGEAAFEIAVHADPGLLYKIDRLAPSLDDPCAIAVSPGKPDLLRFINDYLEVHPLRPRATLREIIDRYLGPTDPAPGEDVPAVAEPGPQDERVDMHDIALVVGLHILALGVLWATVVRRPSAQHWLLSPWTVLAAMGLGGLAGMYLPFLAAYLSRPAGLYMGFWRMCVLPIMVAAIVTSTYRLLACGGNARLLKRLLVWTPLLLLGAALLGVGIGIVGRPGADFSKEAQGLLASMNKGMQTATPGGGLYDQLMDMVDTIVPDNLLAPMVNNENLAVLFVAIFFGVAVAVGKKKARTTLIDIMDTILESFTTMIRMSLYLLPFALYALSLDFIASTGLELMLAILRLVVCLTLAFIPGGLLSLAFLRIRLKIPLAAIWRDFGPIFLLSFSTRSSVISMPIGLERLQNYPQIDRAQITAAYPFALLVCHYAYAAFFALTPVFVGQAFGVSFTPGQYIAIAFLALLCVVSAIGTIGLSYVLLLAIICGPLGLPLEPAVVVGMAAVSIVDPIISGVQALFGCGVATLVVDKANPASDACGDTEMPAG